MLRGRVDDVGSRKVGLGKHWLGEHPGQGRVGLSLQGGEASLKGASTNIQLEVVFNHLAEIPLKLLNMGLSFFQTTKNYKFSLYPFLTLKSVRLFRARGWTGRQSEAAP